ncbi:hypothetical protein Q9L58_002296 [Maublancomyces gigas]|uniref:Uncharacterized protein n=1 Tax=Discina gigas TaxID=1032678 RepID=A0ABR3GS88_9PEZI
MSTTTTRSHSQEVTNHLRYIENAITSVRTLHVKMKAIGIFEGPDFGPNGQFEYIAASVLLRDVGDTMNRTVDIEKISKFHTKVMSIAEKAKLEKLMKQLEKEGEELALQETILKGKVCAHEIKTFRYQRPNY